MIKSDFYKLTIGMEIYYKGEISIVSTLNIDGGDRREWIVFTNESNDNDLNEYHRFIDVMADLSFDPPKQKRKYYEWLIQETKESNPFVEGDILDDNGRHPNGIEYETALAKWGRLHFKQKIEDRSWEF